jgi:hypothetical protein
MASSRTSDTDDASLLDSVARVLGFYHGRGPPSEHPCHAVQGQSSILRYNGFRLLSRELRLSSLHLGTPLVARYGIQLSPPHASSHLFPPLDRFAIRQPRQPSMEGRLCAFVPLGSRCALERTLWQIIPRIGIEYKNRVWACEHIHLPTLRTYTRAYLDNVITSHRTFNTHHYGSKHRLSRLILFFG